MTLITNAPTTVSATLSAADENRIIQMAWEDRTPFEAIEAQFGLTEARTIALMRRHLKRSSFDLWRARVHGRKTKHRLLRDASVQRFRCPDQQS